MAWSSAREADPLVPVISMAKPTLHKDLPELAADYDVVIIDGAPQSTTQSGDGPVDATFNAVKALFPHSARLQLYQVHAVTEGTDAQATVSVRMEEDGRVVTGQSADTDTVVASAKAYVNALNRLIVRREKSAPGEDKREISYKDVS